MMIWTKRSLTFCATTKCSRCSKLLSIKEFLYSFAKVESTPPWTPTLQLVGRTVFFGSSRFFKPWAFGKEQYSNPEIGASHPSILGAFGK